MRAWEAIKQAVKTVFPEFTQRLLGRAEATFPLNETHCALHLFIQVIGKDVDENRPKY